MDVTHNGGQDIERSNLEIQVGNETVSNLDEWPSTISTGDTETVSASDANSPSGGETVRIVWTSSSGGTSNNIGESTVPS